MNSTHRITLEQLEQAQPHKPTCSANDFIADKKRVLEALEEAGAAGLTTRELMDRGGGMRPPNRIHDLRDEGHAIKTIPEGRGVYRYVLCKFLPDETAQREKLHGARVEADNPGQTLVGDPQCMPLFASVVRR